MEDSDEENCNTSNQIIFVAIVKKYPIIFEKSQLPEIKAKKAEAYKEIKDKFNAAFGASMTVQQIMKKLHNMKTRIKNKTCTGKFKSKKTRLKPWEKDFFKFMKETENTNMGSSFIDTEETTSCDDEQPIENDADDAFSEDMEPEDSKSWFEQFTAYTAAVAGPSQVAGVSVTGNTGNHGSCNDTPNPDTIKNCQLPETDETRNLSLPELQRYVLLEQLHVLKLLKEELLLKKMHR